MHINTNTVQCKYNAMRIQIQIHANTDLQVAALGHHTAVVVGQGGHRGESVTCSRRKSFNISLKEKTVSLSTLETLWESFFTRRRSLKTSSLASFDSHSPWKSILTKLYFTDKWVHVGAWIEDHCIDRRSSRVLMFWSTSPWWRQDSASWQEIEPPDQRRTLPQTIPPLRSRLSGSWRDIC